MIGKKERKKPKKKKCAEGESDKFLLRVSLGLLGTVLQIASVSTVGGFSTSISQRKPR